MTSQPAPPAQPAMHDDLARGVLADLGVGGEDALGRGDQGERFLQSINPASGEPIACVRAAAKVDYDHLMARASTRWQAWRTVPAPQRGAVVRLIADDCAAARMRWERSSRSRPEKSKRRPMAKFRR